MDNHPFTVVSAYWNVKNKHDNKYFHWFNNTLKINCPYVFFGNQETIQIVKKIRENLPTYFIECDINEFYLYKYYDFIVEDNRHCPSKELNIIWNEKIFLMNKASEIDPFKSEYFCWIDSGICIYIDSPPPSIPFPDLKKIETLPKDKFIFTSSVEENMENVENSIRTQLLDNNNYCHYISAGVFIMHKSFISTFKNIYKEYIDYLLPQKNNIYTEQVIYTHIYFRNSNLFYKLTDGWGNIIPYLYAEK